MPIKNDFSEIIAPSNKVAAILREEICSGKYEIGVRLANERDLALRFQVSRGTIRQTLKILTAERLIIRQQGRGTFVADPAFAPVSNAQAALIGALIYEKEYYFGAILQSASSQSGIRGYMLTTGSNMNEPSEMQHIEAYLKNLIRGVIIAPRREHSHKAYDRLIKEEIPVVLLDAYIANRDEDFVGVDDYQGAVIATRHLFELGHRKLGYIGYPNPENVVGQWSRYCGFLSACRQEPVEVPDDWILETDDDHYLKAIKIVLSQKNRPSAIVAYNDIWATRLIRVARELDLNIPQDLSVVGFDDSSLARNHDIPITTIHPEPYEMGIAIVNLLIEKIKNPRSRPKRNILITPRLVIRKSTTAF
jgi:GntR family transcriptional regulator of arabinose operon